MRYQLTAVSAFYMLLTVGAAAQSAAGSVLSTSDSAPIAGLPLKVTGPTGNTIVVFTDKTGKWSIDNLAPGAYSVEPIPGSKTDVTTAKQTFTVTAPSPFAQFFGAKPQAGKIATLQLPDNYKALSCDKGC